MSTNFQMQGDKERKREAYFSYDECLSDTGNEVGGNFRNVL